MTRPRRSRQARGAPPRFRNVVRLVARAHDIEIQTRHVVLPETDKWASGICAKFLRNKRRRSAAKTPGQISAALNRTMRRRGHTVITYIPPESMPKPKESTP